MNRKLIATTIVIALMGGPVFAETDPSHEIDKAWAERAKVQEKMAQHMEMMKATMSKLRSPPSPEQTRLFKSMNRSRSSGFLTARVPWVLLSPKQRMDRVMIAPVACVGGSHEPSGYFEVLGENLQRQSRRSETRRFLG